MTNGPSDSRRKLEFVYDSQSRRIEKKVLTWNGSAYVAQSTNRLVYDAWNLFAILNPQSSILQSFMWRLDLSGSMQGAGGVGGLLQTWNADFGTRNFVCYDGNGNVAVLVNVTNGAASANYEYGPFGELIRATGLMAKANPFRFSTKYQDDESDLLYYGYRFYNPGMGQWISRDPLADQAFAGQGKASVSRNDAPVLFEHRNQNLVNIYAFAFNQPISRYDLLGLDNPVPPTVTFKSCPCQCAKDVGDLVLSTLTDIEMGAWVGTPVAQQRQACQNIVQSPGAWDSWDMDSVIGVPVLPRPWPCGPCGTRLTYNGDCYEPSGLSRV